MNDVKYDSSGNNKKEIWRIINFLSLGLLFIVSYQFFYMQAMDYMASDTRGHIGIIKLYMDGSYFLPHPLWHLGAYYMSKLLGVDLNIGASVLTAFLITIYAIIIYKVSQSLDESNDNEAKWFLITFISLTIGPFFIKSFSPYIYIGPGSPSVWHNVTILVVQPFALLSVFFTIKFFTSRRFNYFILAFLVTIISIFAKPSYIMIFLPSLVIFVLLKKYFDKRHLQFAFAVILFSIAVLAYQFINQFSGEGNSESIIFDFLGVWSLYTPNVAVSILLAIGLPLLITLFNYQIVKENEYIKFTWLLVLFSMILFSCFAQDGRHYSDGNFGWSWNISLSLIYIFTIIEYFKQYYSMRPIVRYSLLAIILYQVYIGWYFLIGMVGGVQYIMRVDKFPFF